MPIVNLIHHRELRKLQAQQSRRLVPNIVVLTVGRSGSSVTTQMLATALHLKTGKVDHNCENLGIWSVNEKMRRDGIFDEMAALEALQSIGDPFIVKDPRWRDTLYLWWRVLKVFNPLLLFLEKRDRREVAKSIRKRGGLYTPELHKSCERQFRNWKGRKLRLQFEDVVEASQLIDLSRLGRSVNSAEHHTSLP